MKTVLLISTLISIGVASAQPGTTAQPVTGDEIVASFERMLADRPATVPPLVRTADADPLVNHLGDALWRTGPTFHTAWHSDLVRDSFDRMLAERTPSPAPMQVARDDRDPLRASISAVLWDNHPTECLFAGRDESSLTMAGLN